MALQGTAAEVSFPLKGLVLEEMGEVARRNDTYVVVPMFLAEEAGEEAYSNAAVLLDRGGEVAGIYRKVHPVVARGSSDMEGGVAPGEDFPVFECDFGVLGMQICFDVCFPKGWQVLGRKGVDIVAWPTQSPQTVLPSQYAFKHGYYVVSSTWLEQRLPLRADRPHGGSDRAAGEDPGPSDRSELRPASLAAGAAQREGTVREVR